MSLESQRESGSFRSLCVNLLDCLEKADWPPRNRHVFEQWVYIARKALTEQVAEPPAGAEQPSDDELGLIYHDCCGGCEFMDQGGFEDAARAVLARWGNHSADASKMVTPAEGEVAKLVAWLRLTAGSDNSYSRVRLTRAAELLERHAAPVPVPVNERLPGPQDCDAEGRCWMIYARPPKYTTFWELLSMSVAMRWGSVTHWLPAHALPLPALDQTVTGEHQ